MGYTDTHKTLYTYTYTYTYTTFTILTHPTLHCTALLCSVCLLPLPDMVLNLDPTRAVKAEVMINLEVSFIPSPLALL